MGQKPARGHTTLSGCHPGSGTHHFVSPSPERHQASRAQQCTGVHSPKSGTHHSSWIGTPDPGTHHFVWFEPGREPGRFEPGRGHTTSYRRHPRGDRGTHHPEPPLLACSQAIPAQQWTGVHQKYRRMPQCYKKLARRLASVASTCLRPSAPISGSKTNG